MSDPRTRTRFPALGLADGGYESYYLRAAAPDRVASLWLRHTVHKAPGSPPVGSVWLTLTDGDGPPLVRKRSFASPIAEPGTYVAVGGSVFGPDAVRGSMEDARWDVAFAGEAPPLRHLPSAWMYRAPIPRTKLESPHPSVILEGRVRVGDREVDVGGWAGMVGHNWGAEHAERWIWLHGAGFGDAPGAWADLALGRIRVAGRTAPWVANGVVCVDGVRHRVGGPLGRARVDADALRVDLEVRGAGLTLTGSARSPRARTVVFRYADPDGGEHHVAHCSTAGLDLILRRDGEVPLRLHAAHAGCYELGMREVAHGLPVQPFADP